jgi:hypothetical protein
MSYYRIPNTRYLRIKGNEELDFDAGISTLLIPPINSKIFIHWYKESKLVSTITLTQPTLVENTLKLINGDTNNVSLTAIKIA